MNTHLPVCSVGQAKWGYNLVGPAEYIWSTWWPSEVRLQCTCHLRQHWQGVCVRWPTWTADCKMSEMMGKQAEPVCGGSERACAWWPSGKKEWWWWWLCIWMELCGGWTSVLKIKRLKEGQMSVSGAAKLCVQ